MRNTERAILASLAAGSPLSQQQIDSLMTKIGKGQKKSRARSITDSTELRYAAQVALMTEPEQEVVQRAINDYSNSSAAINQSCRDGDPNANALNIDAMFVAFARIGYANVRRVTYRLMTFAADDHLPYGSPTAPTISVGDRITDPAFVSASENRQLLVHGVTNPAAGSRYVKMSIVGHGGVNISGGSTYTNANEQALVDQLYPRKWKKPSTWRKPTAHAGQAEILYPRDTIFRVEKINQSGNDVHVVLSVPGGDAGVLKNSFTGQ